MARARRAAGLERDAEKPECPRPRSREAWPARAGDPGPIHAAKTNLSKLIEQVHAGEEVVIARGDVPVARLVPIAEKLPTRQAGTLRGLIQVTDAFFEPLPPDELDAWESKTR